MASGWNTYARAHTHTNAHACHRERQVIAYVTSISGESSSRRYYIETKAVLQHIETTIIYALTGNPLQLIIPIIERPNLDAIEAKEREKDKFVEIGRS